MNTKKILFVFGTRPEAIKMAPLILECIKYKDRFTTKICVTGQHKEMLQQVLDFFSIVPDHNLEIMKESQDLYDITAKVILGLKNILLEEKPDYVIVHGDTTTTMAASLSAFYQKISVIHIEAGLRTNNMYSPWPEEINRQITSKIASIHFAPTSVSKNNLLKENIPSSIIEITGNTVIDALISATKIIDLNPKVRRNIIENIFKSGYDSSRLQSGKKMILITGHRRENFGQGFLNICIAIQFLSQKYPEIDFIYPMHLNPNVRDAVKTVFGDNVGSNNLFLIEPLEYKEFVFLMAKSYFILTDSGGVQEEAPSLGKPVLVMRDTTERPEAIQSGTVKLVGTDTDKIIRESILLIENENSYIEMSTSKNPYGDGKASEKIISRLFSNNFFK